MCPPPCRCHSTIPAAVVTTVAAIAAGSAALEAVGEILLAVLVVVAIACAAGAAFLVHVLRRDRLALWRPRRALEGRIVTRPAQALSGPRPRAIEAPRPSLADLERLAAEHGHAVIRQAQDDD